MGRSDVKPPSPKQAVWENWSDGSDIRGWTLRCGPMFCADVRRISEAGNYYGTLNSDVLGNDPDPKMMALIDREIIRRMREMSAGYKILHARNGKLDSRKQPCGMNLHRRRAPFSATTW